MKVLSKFQPHHVTPLILVELGSKFHTPSPSSLGEDLRKPPTGIKRFSVLDRRDKHYRDTYVIEITKKYQVV